MLRVCAWYAEWLLTKQNKTLLLQATIGDIPQNQNQYRRRKANSINKARTRAHNFVDGQLSFEERNNGRTDVSSNTYPSVLHKQGNKNHNNAVLFSLRALLCARFFCTLQADGSWSNLSGYPPPLAWDSCCTRQSTASISSLPRKSVATLLAVHTMKQEEVVHGCVGSIQYVDNSNKHATNARRRTEPLPTVLRRKKKQLPTLSLNPLRTAPTFSGRTTTWN